MLIRMLDVVWLLLATVQRKGGEERRTDCDQAERTVPGCAAHELSFQPNDESEQPRQQDLAKQLQLILT
jgi:hypothetical protein